MKMQNAYVVLMVLWLIWFWNSAIRGIFLVIVPGLKDELLLSASVIGLTLSGFTLGNGFGRFSCGFLSKRFGLKSVVSLGIISATVFSALFSFYASFYSLIILFPVVGFMLGLYQPSAISLLTELFEENRRGFMIGIHETAVPIGLAVGPIFLGLAISFGLGWTGALQTWSLVALIALIFFVRFVKEPKQQTQHSSQNVSKSISISKGGDPHPLWVLIALVLMAGEMSGAGSNVLVPLTIIDKFGVELEGLAFLMGASTLTGALGQILAGNLSDRIGRLRTLMIFPILNAVRMLGLAYSPAGPFFYMFLLMSFFNHGVMPVFYTLLGEMFSFENRGKMLGIMMFAVSTINGLHPTVTGWLIDQSGLQIAWFLPIGLAVLGSVTAYIIDRYYFHKIPAT